MANTQHLDRRIGSVKNTRKITRAMEMVAAAKLRKAQDRIQTLRPFAEALLELTARVALGAKDAVNHPLLQAREVEDVAIVMYTGRPRPRRRAQRERPQALARPQVRVGSPGRVRALHHGRAARRRLARLPRHRGGRGRGLRGHHRQPEVPRRRGHRRHGADRLPRRRLRQGRARLQPLRLGDQPDRRHAGPAPPDRRAAAVGGRAPSGHPGRGGQRWCPRGGRPGLGVRAQRGRAARPAAPHVRRADVLPRTARVRPPPSTARE